MTAEPLKVLLVEDDEDDFLLARGLLSEVGGRNRSVRFRDLPERAGQTRGGS